MKILYRQTIPISAGLILALAICFLLYTPALHGPFVFDDWGSLPALRGFNAGIHPGLSFWWYVFGNNSGPLNRPLSMLSFLINDNAWPSDPYSFKYTNVLLHLLNGVLVFALVRNLLRRRQSTNANVELIALITTALWMMNPIHTATILQTVQRMTLLASLFILLGILAYLKGCERLESGHTKAAWLHLIPGMALCGLLSILSKETGALLPFYLLALHLTIAPLPARRGTQIWAVIFLWLPLVVFCAYIALSWQSIRAGYTTRDFTLDQRLLTEPRIIVIYLREIFAPNYIARGLFFDGFRASTGWLTPWTTLPCILLLASVLAIAVNKRRTWPWLAFAVFWFMAGHLIESTVFPLELFFLHRNYLAMIGPLLAIIVWVMGKTDSRWPLRLLPLALYGGLLVWQTAVGAKVWSSELTLGATWVEEQPQSLRAHQLLARAWYNERQPSRAESVLDAALHLPNPDASTALQWAFVRCATGHARLSDWDLVMPIIQSSGVATAAPDALNEMRPLIGQCPSMTHDKIEAAINTLLGNHKNMSNAIVASNTWRIEAELAVDNHDLNDAIQALEHSYTARPDILTAVRAAELLHSAGLDADAQHFVELANHTPAPTLWLRVFNIRPIVQ